MSIRAPTFIPSASFYELLVGTPPFNQELPFDELLRKVREEDPERPSKLEKHLSADLDWITLKALEKDRERRYRSPADLASDLGRYLRSEPVEAAPPSRTYRSEERRPGEEWRTR